MGRVIVSEKEIRVICQIGTNAPSLALTIHSYTQAKGDAALEFLLVGDATCVNHSSFSRVKNWIDGGWKDRYELIDGEMNFFSPPKPIHSQFGDFRISTMKIPDMSEIEKIGIKHERTGDIIDVRTGTKVISYLMCQEANTYPKNIYDIRLCYTDPHSQDVIDISTGKNLFTKELTIPLKDLLWLTHDGPVHYKKPDQFDDVEEIIKGVEDCVKEPNKREGLDCLRKFIQRTVASNINMDAGFRFELFTARLCSSIVSDGEWGMNVKLYDNNLDSRIWRINAGIRATNARIRKKNAKIRKYNDNNPKKNKTEKKEIQKITKKNYKPKRHLPRVHSHEFDVIGMYKSKLILIECKDYNQVRRLIDEPPKLLTRSTQQFNVVDCLRIVVTTQKMDEETLKRYAEMMNTKVCTIAELPVVLMRELGLPHEGIADALSQPLSEEE